MGNGKEDEMDEDGDGNADRDADGDRDGRQEEDGRREERERVKDGDEWDGTMSREVGAVVRT